MDKVLIDEIAGNGIFSPVGENPEPYFTWRGCDRCANGLGATVYDCIGYKNLEEAKDVGNRYEFKICGQCLYEITYGKEEG